MSKHFLILYSEEDKIKGVLLEENSYDHFENTEIPKDHS